MAPPSFSPDASISSRTLSVGSAPLAPMDINSTPNPLASLLSAPASFLQPVKASQASVLSASKQFLDHVAAAVSEAQTARQQELRRKRKRGGDYDDMEVLHLKKVHLDGFSVGQVFEQGRKILESAIDEVELSLPELGPDGMSVGEGSDSEAEISGPEGDDSDSSIGAEGVDWEYDVDSDAVPGTDSEDEEASEGEEGEGVEDEEEDEDEDEDMEDAEDIFSDGESVDDEPVATTYEPDPNGLNDGFFSIDDFNKNTDFLEQQDARGQGEDDSDDDEEEIDWATDPMAEGVKKTKKTKKSGDVSDDDSDDEGGPTFGNVDLNAPEGDSDDDEPLDDGDMDGLGDMTNANNLMYADFYMPPATKTGNHKNKDKKKKGRPNPHNFPDKKPTSQLEGQEDDIERTIAAVQRDLFEEEDDMMESEAELSELDPSDPMSRRSTHERKSAKLAEDIRRLEAANVAKRQWQLSGEARANDRPLNSLLEEDLDFERAGKPVPVITEEVREELDALIKRRILASEFDEITRRRPDDLAVKVRRGQFELPDTKSAKGLAEIYEEEHLREMDPNFVDARDEKLKKEHAEIEALWTGIRGKLDSLTSWHYKPKPAVANLEIRTDAPAIEMEDARPTAGGDVAGASMLAPQELYKPGEEKDYKEIVTKSGMPIAREEMSREQKLRRRRREKSKIHKANLNEAPKEATVAEKKTKSKKTLIGDLKRGGVQVIGKKGQVTDVEGKEVKEAHTGGAGNFKL